MTTTANFNLKDIAQGDQSPWVTINTNMAILDAALAAVSPYASKRSVNYDANGALTTNLTFGSLGGILRKGVTLVTTSSSSSLSLTASATNYVEVDESGVVSFNTTGFTPGKIPLYTVTTDATKKTAITDKRAWLVVPRNPRLAKSVAGGADVTLSATEALHDVLSLSGALTANINVIVPAIEKQWTVANLTSGAFTLTVKTSAGTGITITQGQRAVVYCDGTNVVLAAAEVPVSPLLSKSVAGGVDITMTAAETLSGILEFTGALTASINVIVPATARQWTVANLTSGAYTLTVKTAAGSGITITQGQRAVVYCDGTNVARVTADI